MVKLTINGKEYNTENVDILINYDYIKDKTDLKMYNGREELSFDSKSTDFNITIDLNSTEANITKIVDSNRDIEASVQIIDRANQVISHELKNISEQRNVALEIYQFLCKSILKGSENK